MRKRKSNIQSGKTETKRNADDSTSTVGNSNALANLEIIDLRPEDPNNLFNDPDLSCGAEFFDDLLSNESLYSSYLNGQITFDDLMRAVHRKEPSETNREPFRELTDTNSVDSDESEDESAGSDVTSDPEFIPPPRLRTRNRGRPRRRGDAGGENTSGNTNSAIGTTGAEIVPKRTRKGSLPLELTHYLGEAERFLNSGHFDEAEEICQNVISQAFLFNMCVLYRIAEFAIVEDGCFILSAPQASEPYTVLAEVYYRRGDHNRAKEQISASDYRSCTTKANCTWSPGLQDRPIGLFSSRETPHSRTDDRPRRTSPALKSEQPSYYICEDIHPTPRYERPRPGCATKATSTGTRKQRIAAPTADRSPRKFFMSYCDVSLIKANRKRLSPNSITGSRNQAKLYTSGVSHILFSPFYPSFSRCTYPRTLSTELTVKLFLVLVRLQFTTAITYSFSPSLFCKFVPFLATRTEAVYQRFSQRHYDWLLDIVKTYRKIGMNFYALQLLTHFHFRTTKTVSGACEGLRPSALTVYRAQALHPSSVMETNPSGQKARKVRFAKPGETTIAAGTALTKEASTTRRKIDTRADFDMDTETEWDEEDAEVEDEDDEEGTSSRAQARADAEWLATSNAIPDAALLAHDPIAYRLAFERCRMLDQPDTVDSFLDETWTLLFSDVARLCGPKWAQFTRFLESMRLRNRLMERLSADTTAAGSEMNTPSTAAERNVSGFDIWGLFLRLIDVLQSRLPRSLSFLESATAWACLLPQIHSEDGRRQAASNLLISACLLGGHGSPALIKLRELRTQYGQSNQFWNTMNIAITLSRDLRHSRFVDRVFMKESSNYAAAILANNDRIVRGSYRYATGRLIEMRQVNPNDPLVHLLLSIGFLGMALQKHVASRHPAVLQALGFISEYRRLRGHCQEVYYNIARLCHQLLLNHVAIAYYEKVLQTEPVGNTETEKALSQLLSVFHLCPTLPVGQRFRPIFIHQYTDLRPEAAFNLILLYRSQGNHAMAHYLMQKHLVI
ncbi:hypothetical protein FGIG_09778 [Fasciola gigantica]|uniref:General transcription factor 3C polypeptide 3 n=1 Tax=Fasciola gigantica TaxID=46835 RepID=A0A504YTE7_FASGI|nr:hypothetical protein FGIG_09778 [Fasciola gigantica]